MASEVKLRIRVTDEGDLELIGKKAKKAAKETDGLKKSTDQTSDSRKRFSRGEKGVAGATNNSTKAFSKMRDSMTGSGGLVPAYATLAANVFALSAAFGVLQRAAQLEQLKVGFNALANSAGRTATVIVDSIQQISDGAVSADQAFRSAAAGFNAGFSQLEIERLTKIAKNASQALGRNLPDSLDRLIRGTAKLEPEILDELGLFVRLDDAVQKYATTLNKASSQLTESERRQAFLNEALAQGELKFGGLEGAIPANPFDKLAANFDKISKTFLSLAGTVLGPLIELLATSTTALVGVLILFGRTISGQIFPVLENLGGKYAFAALAAQESAEDQIKAQQKLIKESKKEVKATSPINEKSRFADIQKKIRAKEKVDLKELKIAQDSLALSEEKRALNLSKYEGEILVKKQAELDLVRQQKLAVENLIAAEKGRGKFQVGASRAEKLGKLEGGVSDAVENIQTGGAVEGFKTANKALNEYRTDKVTLIRTTESYKTGNRKLDRMLKKIAIGFRVGGTAARLFGTALLNAIPIIGQIIFVVGLVIQGLTSLYNAVFPVSETMERFNDIVDALDDKLKQLADTNDTLNAKYYQALLAQEQAKKSSKTLTKERLNEIAATARSHAGVEAYANTLKVTAGVTEEFADASALLARELSQQEEPGFISKLASYVTNGIFAGINAGLDYIASGFRAIKELLTDNVITRGFADAAEFLGDLGRRVLGEDLAAGIDIAPVLRKVNDFKSTVIGQFEELQEKAPDIAKTIESSLNGQTFEDFVAAQFEGIKTAKSYEEAMKLFDLATTRVNGTLRVSAAGNTAASDSLSKFGKNVEQAGSSLTKFRNKFFKKGEYGELANQVKQAANSIKAMREAAEAPGSTITFAEAITRAVDAGEIKLSDYGTTLDEVKEKGEAAFQPMVERFEELDEATRSYKQRVAELKGQLDQLKSLASLRELTFEIKDMVEGLKKSGEATQLAGRGLGDLYDRRKQLQQDIVDQGEIRKKLINEEIDLEIQKLKIIQAGLGAGAQAATQRMLIGQLIADLERSRQSRKGAVDTDVSTQKGQIDADTLSTGQALRQQLQGVADTGDTAADRLANLGVQFVALGDAGLSALDFFDEAGVKIGDNFAGKVMLARSALQPMINDLKGLGADGEIAASLGQMISDTTLAFARLGDAIQQAFGVEATGSMQAFTEAWNAESATLQQKAQVAAAAFAAVGAALGGLASALREKNQKAIDKIDEQIKQEKKLDGKSKESVAKILMLEKKKEAAKKKAFETDKKLRLAQAIMNTAAGIAAALTIPIVGPAIAAVVGALGAAQIAIISGMTYDGGSKAPSGNVSQINMGNRGNSVDLASSRSARGELAYFRGESGTGGPENFKNAFGGYKNRAEGGNTAFMVGEQGPELFVPETPGTIVPNDDIVGGGSTNVTFNISTVDATGVEDLLMRQQGNIIGMIRGAANSYGQDFIEEVDTSVFGETTGGALKY